MRSVLPIANRPRAELEGLIGFFVNTLVLRADLSGSPTFRRLLGRVRESTLQAYAHQDVPFKELVDALQPARALTHSPLFNVMLVFQNIPQEKTSVDSTDVRLGSAPVEVTNARFDLTLTIVERGGELLCTLDYATDLFTAATMQRFCRHFARLLTGALARPDPARLGAAVAR